MVDATAISGPAYVYSAASDSRGMVEPWVFADTQHPGPLFAGMPHRHQGVHGLARLRDGHDQRLPVEDGVAIAELASQFHLDRNPCPMLDRVLRDQSRVKRGAACHDHDLVDLAQLDIRDVEPVEGEPVVLGDPSEQGVGHRLGLLGDLLEHEQVVAALLGGAGIPGDLVLDAGGLPAVEVGDGHPLASDGDDLVLTEFHRAAGVGDEGGHVAGQERLAVADTDDQRGVAAGTDQRVRVVGGRRHQGEGTTQLPTRLLHRLGEVVRDPQVLGQQMGGDLRVGLAEEGHATCLQLVAQFGEVLDDPVVDDRQPAVLAQMRVGVDVVGGTVRRPAGVSDSDGRAGQRGLSERLLQVRQLAGALARLHPGGCHDRNPGRVVPPVLESAQTRHDHICGVLTADVPHDSAHVDNATRPREVVSYPRRSVGSVPEWPGTS